MSKKQGNFSETLDVLTNYIKDNFDNIRDEIIKKYIVVEDEDVEFLRSDFYKNFVINCWKINFNNIYKHLNESSHNSLFLRENNDYLLEKNKVVDGSNLKTFSFDLFLKSRTVTDSDAKISLNNNEKDIDRIKDFINNDLLNITNINFVDLEFLKNADEINRVMFLTDLKKEQLLYELTRNDYSENSNIKQLITNKYVNYNFNQDIDFVLLNSAMNIFRSDDKLFKSDYINLILNKDTNKGLLNCLKRTNGNSNIVMQVINCFFREINDSNININDKILLELLEVFKYYDKMVNISVSDIDLNKMNIFTNLLKNTSSETKKLFSENLERNLLVNEELSNYLERNKNFHIALKMSVLNDENQLIEDLLKEMIIEKDNGDLKISVSKKIVKLIGFNNENCSEYDFLERVNGLNNKDYEKKSIKLNMCDEFFTYSLECKGDFVLNKEVVLDLVLDKFMSLEPLFYKETFMSSYKDFTTGGFEKVALFNEGLEVLKKELLLRNKFEKQAIENKTVEKEKRISTKKI